MLKGKRGPGHMGFVLTTVQKLEIVHVDAAKNLIALKGAVPGPNGNLVLIKPTVKKLKARVAQPVKAAKASAPAKAKAKPTPSKAAAANL